MKQVPAEVMQRHLYEKPDPAVIGDYYVDKNTYQIFIFNGQDWALMESGISDLISEDKTANERTTETGAQEFTTEELLEEMKGRK